MKPSKLLIGLLSEVTPLLVPDWGTTQEKQNPLYLVKEKKKSENVYCVNPFLVNQGILWTFRDNGTGTTFTDS